MAGTLARDENLVPVLGLVDETTGEVRPALAASATGRLKVAATGGGGGGTPGGSSGQVQWNNAGSFGGITGATTNGTTLTLVAPVLGTPASATLTNATGLPISTGVSGLGTNVASFLATPSSANLAAAVTDETGSGALVFATSPVLVTPTIGVATATSLNKVTITAPATTATLTIADGKTLTQSNTLTYTGTDGSSVNFGAGGTVLYGNQSITLSGDVTGTGSTAITTTVAKIAGTAVSGTTGSTNVVFSNSPTLVTPTLGVASATSINKVAITAPATSATLTIADGKTVTHNATTTFAGTDGKTLTVSNSLTLAGTDSTVMTFPTTSASIARTDAGQTFTGVQTMTSPSITTSLVTGSASFDLLNTTATTVNFAGAATTLNIGASATCILNFGGSTTASEFRFLEPSGSGTNYTAFKAQAQAGNVTYTLPAADSSGTQYLSSNGSGTLSWGTPSGLSWGTSISGTTDSGLAMTLSNTSDDGAAALKITAGNTQSNQPVLANLQIGTSGNAMGLLIQGTGGNTAGAAGTGLNHLTLWGNTSANNKKLLSIGNGTSYTETFYIDGEGHMFLTPGATSNAVLGITPTNQANAFVLINGATASGAYTANGFLRVTPSYTGAAVAISANTYRFEGTRTYNASGTQTSTYDHMSVIRTVTTSNASANTTENGSVLRVENVSTQTSGTLTNAVVVAKIIQDADSTGVPLEFTQNAVTSTHFRKIWSEANTGISIWMSDGTDPNGALSGTAGDICYNGASNKPAYCTGTTNWTNLV